MTPLSMAALHRGAPPSAVTNRNIVSCRADQRHMAWCFVLLQISMQSDLIAWDDTASPLGAS
jgi:hypothetical protein